MPRRLEEPLLGGIGGVDDRGAGRAVPAHLQRRAAGRVADRLRIDRAPGAPVGEQPQGRGEVAAVGRQVVGEAGRALLVRRGADDAVAFQAAQAIGEDVRRDPGERLAELAEPTRPVEQRLDDQQAPAVADAIEGGFERERVDGRSSRSMVAGRGLASIRGQ